MIYNMLDPSQPQTQQNNNPLAMWNPLQQALGNNNLSATTALNNIPNTFAQPGDYNPLLGFEPVQANTQQQLAIPNVQAINSTPNLQPMQQWQPLPDNSNVPVPTANPMTNNNQQGFASSLFKDSNGNWNFANLGLLAQGAGALGSLWLGWQGLKNMKAARADANRQFEMNYNAQRKDYNRKVEDRYRRRGSFEGSSQQEIDDNTRRHQL